MAGLIRRSEFLGQKHGPKSRLIRQLLRKRIFRSGNHCNASVLHWQSVELCAATQGRTVLSLEWFDVFIAASVSSTSAWIIHAFTQRATKCSNSPSESCFAETATGSLTPQRRRLSDNYSCVVFTTFTLVRFKLARLSAVLQIFFVAAEGCCCLTEGLPASEMTYIVSSGALNSTHSLTYGKFTFWLRSLRFLHDLRGRIFAVSCGSLCGRKSGKVVDL